LVSSRQCFARRTSSEEPDMREEPVVEEIHRVRREISAEFNDDVHTFFEYLRQREAERPDQVVTLERILPDPVAVDRRSGT
jgi:hypothetical protein